MTKNCKLIVDVILWQEQKQYNSMIGDCLNGQSLFLTVRIFSEAYANCIKIGYPTHKKSIGFDSNCVRPFFFADRNLYPFRQQYSEPCRSAKRHFYGALFLFIIVTERKPYQRDDRYCYGTIDGPSYGTKNIFN